MASGAMIQAERTRAYRRRQRAGIAVLDVPVAEYDFAETLIRGGWLTPDEALDKANLAHCAAKIIGEFVEKKQKCEYA
jgi:hypothetical protein